MFSFHNLKKISDIIENGDLKKHLWTSSPM